MVMKCGEKWAKSAVAGEPPVVYDLVVSEASINLEEKIDRQVGKRTRRTDALEAGLALQALGAELHQGFQHRWCPKGVYRFKTHEEADAWTRKMLARSSL